MCARINYGNGQTGPAFGSYTVAVYELLRAKHTPEYFIEVDYDHNGHWIPAAGKKRQPHVEGH